MLQYATLCVCVSVFVFSEEVKKLFLLFHGKFIFILQADFLLEEEFIFLFCL